MKVLVVEDDRDIAELIAYNLKEAQFRVETMANGRQGLAEVRRHPPDLIILDLMLPDLNGLEICKAIRSSENIKKIPIIMLTAKGEEMDRVVGLEVGADDYLTKPFSPRELVLRVKAIIKRTHETAIDLGQQEFNFGPLHVDTSKFQVTVGKEPIHVTALELKLLTFLHSLRGRVATRDVLLDRVWGYDATLTTRTVDTHIKRLREKLGVAGTYIETIRGVGYRFKEVP